MSLSNENHTSQSVSLWVEKTILLFKIRVRGVSEKHNFTKLKTGLCFSALEKLTLWRLLFHRTATNIYVHVSHT